MPSSFVDPKSLKEVLFHMAHYAHIHSKCASESSYQDPLKKNWGSVLRECKSARMQECGAAGI